MTDGIADLLTRIRNGARARHERVKMPFSKAKKSVLGVLSRDGYIGQITEAGEGPNKELIVDLKYSDTGESVILGLKMISRPGCRKYVKVDSIPQVASGLGISIISTPKGVMTNKEATEQHLGGELLCNIW